MTRFGKTILWSVLSVVGASAILAPAQAVPCGPKLHAKPMTKPHGDDIKDNRDHQFDGLFNYQYSATVSGVTASGNLSPTTGGNNVTINGVTSSWTGVTGKPTFTQTTPGAAFQFTETLSSPGLQKSYNHPESDRGYKRNRHYKYLPAVIALLFSSPVNAETVGGVSATASPIANSSETGDEPGDSGFTRSIYY